MPNHLNVRVTEFMFLYLRMNPRIGQKKLHVVERGKVFLKKCLKKLKNYFENLQKTV